MCFSSTLVLSVLSLTENILAVYYSGSRERFEMAEKHISIPYKPFSSGDISEWFQRFEICCKANSSKKALKLPTLLEGEGLAVCMA